MNSNLIETLNAKYIINNDNNIILKLKVPVKKVIKQIILNNKNEIILKKNVVINLDYGYYMRRHYLDIAKKCIYELLENIYHKVDEIHIILTDFSLGRINFKIGDIFSFKTGENFNEFILRFQNYNKYSSSFEYAFEEIQTILNLSTNISKCSTSYFSFTGGNNYWLLNKEINNSKSISNILKSHISANKDNSFDIHLIYFGKDINTYFLNYLIEVGTDKGTFQNVNTSSDIKECIHNLTQILSSKRLKFGFGDGLNLVKPFTLNHLNEAIVILENNQFNLEKLKLFFKIEGSTGEYTEYKSIANIQLSQIKEESRNGDYQMIKSDIIQSKIYFLAEKIINFINSSSTNDELDTFEISLTELNNQLNDMYFYCGKITLKNRRQVRIRLLTLKKLKKLLKENIDLVKNKQFEKVKFYRWQAIASKYYLLINKGTKTANKYHIIKDTKFDKDKEKITKLSQVIDADKLKSEIDPKVIKVIQCSISNLNIIEALEENDCLAIGLWIKRTGDAVLEPSNIQIIDIIPSFVSCNSFIDILSFKIKLEEIHQLEMYEKISHSTIYPPLKIDAGNKRLNAIMPLYLHPKHWEVASNQSKKIFTWMTTLSTENESDNEIKVIPFMILSRCIELFAKNPSENYKFMLKLIFETCLAVYQYPFQSRIVDETKKQFEDYKSGAINRTFKIIPNHNLFLMKLLCANYLGDISNNEMSSFLTTMKNYMFEEAIARKLNVKWHIPVQYNIMQKLLNINGEKHINKVLDKCKNDKIYHIISSRLNESNLTYAEMFLNDVEVIQNNNTENNNFNNENKEMMNFIKIPKYKFKNTDFSISNEALEFIKSIENFVKFELEDLNLHFNTLTLDFKKLLDTSTPLASQLSYITELNKSYDYFNIWPLEQLLCILHQSYCHKEGESRQNAIEKGNYIDFINNDKSKEMTFSYIGKLYENFINKTLEAKRKETIKSIKHTCALDLATQFIMSKELEECAGILKYGVKSRCVLSFHYCILKLQTNLSEVEKLDINYELRLTKLKMLVFGKYNDKELFSDKINLVINPYINKFSKHWYPSDKNVKKFCMVFKEWKHKDINIFNNLFPNQKELILKIFKK